MFKRIEEIKERRSKITEGNWMVCLGSGINVCTGVKSENQTTGETIFIADFLSEKIINETERSYDHRCNMSFIANAPEDIKYLLSVIEQLKTITELRSESNE